MVAVLGVQRAVISKPIINIYISQALKQPMQLKHKQDIAWVTNLIQLAPLNLFIDTNVQPTSLV